LLSGTVSFDASDSTPEGGEIASYKWNFGDGTSPSTVYVRYTTHVFPTNNTFTVTLNVTDSEGLWCTTSKPVKVSPVGPTAVFTYFPSDPFVDETTTFNASSSTPGWNGTARPPIVSYEWNFGDGTSPVIESDPITTHIFRANDTFTVTLNVTDSRGLWDTTSKPVTVFTASGPIANFTYSPSEPVVNVTTTFDASSSTPGWNGTARPPIVSYEWNFGDGTSPVIESNPLTTHIFTTEGDHMVTLNVTDTMGWWNTTSKLVKVITPYGPTAVFTYFPSDPFVNGTTTFNASSSTPGWNGTANPPIVSYEWNFGDGTSPVIESDPITTHIFRANDTFTVTLNVTDSEGRWDIMSQNVTVIIASVKRDVAIVSVTYMPTVAYESSTPPVDIAAVVRNNGTTLETFNVTAYYKNATATEWTPTETKNIIDLDPLAETTVHFTWNTSTLPLYINYTIKVETSPIQNDTNPGDNTVIPGTIMSKMTGDANGNRVVEADDIIFEVGPALGSRPGDPNWNPNADFNGNGIVEADDIIFELGPNLGRSYP